MYLTGIADEHHRMETSRYQPPGRDGAIEARCLNGTYMMYPMSLTVRWAPDEAGVSFRIRYCQLGERCAG